MSLTISKFTGFAVVFVFSFLMRALPAQAADFCGVTLSASEDSPALTLSTSDLNTYKNDFGFLQDKWKNFGWNNTAMDNPFSRVMAGLHFLKKTDSKLYNLSAKYIDNTYIECQHWWFGDDAAGTYSAAFVFGYGTTTVYRSGFRASTDFLAGMFVHEARHNPTYAGKIESGIPKAKRSTHVDCRGGPWCDEFYSDWGPFRLEVDYWAQIYHWGMTSLKDRSTPLPAGVNFAGLQMTEPSLQRLKDTINSRLGLNFVNDPGFRIRDFNETLAERKAAAERKRMETFQCEMDFILYKPIELETCIGRLQDRYALVTLTSVTKDGVDLYSGSWQKMTETELIKETDSYKMRENLDGRGLSNTDPRYKAAPVQVTTPAYDSLFSPVEPNHNALRYGIRYPLSRWMFIPDGWGRSWTWVSLRGIWTDRDNPYLSEGLIDFRIYRERSYSSIMSTDEIIPMNLVSMTKVGLSKLDLDQEIRTRGTPIHLSGYKNQADQLEYLAIWLEKKPLPPPSSSSSSEDSGSGFRVGPSDSDEDSTDEEEEEADALPPASNLRASSSSPFIHLTELQNKKLSALGIKPFRNGPGVESELGLKSQKDSRIAEYDLTPASLKQKNLNYLGRGYRLQRVVSYLSNNPAQPFLFAGIWSPHCEDNQMVSCPTGYSLTTESAGYKGIPICQREFAPSCARPLNGYCTDQKIVDGGANFADQYRVCEWTTDSRRRLTCYKADAKCQSSVSSERQLWMDPSVIRGSDKCYELIKPVCNFR